MSENKEKPVVNEESADTLQAQADVAEQTAPSEAEAAVEADAPQTSETEKAPAPKKRNKLKNILLSVLLVVVIAALACVAINMFVPGFLDGILNTTPLTRDSVVMTLGDFKITAEEYNHYLYPYKAEKVAAGDENYWKTHLEENKELIQTAEDFFIDKYAMLGWAEELGVTATDEEIETAVAETKASYETEEEFYAMLEENYVTLDLYYRLVGQSLTQNKLLEALNADETFTAVTDEEAAAYIEAQGLLGAKHIFFLTQGLEDAEIAEKKLLAAEVLAKLEAGEDFDELMYTYTEDTGLYSYPNGYVFTPDQMVEAFTEAVQALAVGEHSAIVESELGLHIILRTQPAATDYVMSADGSASTLQSLLLQERFDARLDEYVASNGIKKGFGYSKLNVDQTKWDYPVVNS